MNTWLKAVLAIGILAGGAAQAEPGESALALRFRGMAPSEDEDWDSAGGVELQWRHWSGGNVGLALAAGISSWEAVSEFVEDYGGDWYYSSLIEGSATVVPVGVSLLARGALGPALDLVAEGGVRYVFVDSGVDASTFSEDRGGARSTAETIEIDDTWVGLLGLGLEAYVTPNMALHAGLEYQFDLGAPGETYLGEDIGETSFAGFGFTLGVTIRF